MSKQIVLRSKKVAFMETTEGKFGRMQGFTSLTTNKNPQEYSRQYVDEAFETTDIVGMSTSMDYEFDQMKGNAVHDEIIDVSDNEKLGQDAVREIVVVDLSAQDGGETAPATKRPFAIVPESDGDGTEAYKYSGTFRVQGERVEGTATTTDNWKTITFEESIV